MANPSETLIGLEKKFWQSMVDEDADTAIDLLCEPALMVSAHGAMQFDHAGYKHMAENGDWILKSFELSDVHVVFPNDNTAVVTYHVKQEVSSRKKGDGSLGSFQEMNDTSTWIRDGKNWKCVVHTETPSQPGSAEALARFRAIAPRFVSAPRFLRTGAGSFRCSATGPARTRFRSHMRPAR